MANNQIKLLTPQESASFRRARNTVSGRRTRTCGGQLFAQTSFKAERIMRLHLGAEIAMTGQGHQERFHPAIH
ncbi:MAG: hypothetical protein H0T64_09730, partial [Pyrinomonadaceae bacterium]|nr:hypothetical protein [Pyrinomonadaceae bacterium]